ncbi:hypothetical protein LSUE1_G001506 [Lachnellula suecica]|uniref:Large ribosomal subunit protein mL50 n=1 Tax=Lachnellula suecica TaxID=602035 RepID=A0A8T9CLJ3_9HELO|nr:hypothetical protein LSUE1_G001506 [Lachnellula suecica]
MRRISRSCRPIGHLRVNATRNTPSYVCATCRSQAPSFSTSSIRTDARDRTLGELRKKIWGTDVPPGLENPYGDKSNIEKLVVSKQKAKGKATEAPMKPNKTAATTPSSDYEPATTWDGLEEVGGENRNTTNQFRGFLAPDIVTDTDELTAALHRAMVEVFALKQAGLPLLDVSQTAPGFDSTLDVQIVSSTGGVQLKFGENSSLEQVIQSLAKVVDETAEKEDPTESEENVAADRSEVDPLQTDKIATPVDETIEKGNPTEAEEDIAADRSEEGPLKHAQPVMTYEELFASWDPSWLQISVDDPEIKFAVLKRTLQLTGVRVPDSAMKSARTAQSILSHLVTPPKPRKLIEALEQKEDLLSLPNVSMSGRRVTPIDREKAAGRWKLIEKELESRGLPVTGH